MSDAQYLLPPTFERCLDSYFREIDKYPLLSRDEEVALARRIKQGDQEALQLLVLSNLRFVVSVAKKYVNRGLMLSDLINEGNIGLLKAAERFDAERGFRFISYAVWWVRQGVTQALKEKARTVRLPQSQNMLLGKVKKVERELQQEGVLYPAPEQIAERLDQSLVVINRLLQVNQAMLTINDDGREGDQLPLVETLEAKDQVSPEKCVLVDSLRNDIERSLGNLTERQAAVVKRYFGLGYEEAQTLQEIGEVMGLTRERIRQVKEMALAKLRGVMSEEQF